MTLLVLGAVFAGVIFSLVLIPLLLVRTVLGLSFALISVPFQVVGALVGGLARVVFKGMFWLAFLLIPLAVVAFPLTIMMLGAWLLFRALRPRRTRQAYVVA